MRANGAPPDWKGQEMTDKDHDVMGPPDDYAYQLRQAVFELFSDGPIAQWGQPSDPARPKMSEPLSERQTVLAGLISAMPEKWRDIWCNGPSCACLGCANVSGALVKNGFSKADWEAYRKQAAAKALK